MALSRTHDTGSVLAIIKNAEGATKEQPAPYAVGRINKFTVCIVLPDGPASEARSRLLKMRLGPKDLPDGCTVKDEPIIKSSGTLYNVGKGMSIEEEQGDGIKKHAAGLKKYFRNYGKTSPFKNPDGSEMEDDAKGGSLDDKAGQSSASPAQNQPADDSSEDESDSGQDFDEDESESSDDEAEQPPVASARDQADSNDDESDEPTLTRKQSNDLENLIRDLVISSNPSEYLNTSQLAPVQQYGKPIRQQFQARMERGEEFEDVLKVFMKNLWPKRHDQNFSRSLLGLETGALKTKWLGLYKEWTSRQVAVLDMILEYQQVADRLLEEKDLPSVTEDGDSWGKLNDISDTISDWEIEGLLKKATGDRTQGEQAEAIAELLTVLKEQQEYLLGSSELQDIDKPEFGLQEGTVTDLVTAIKTFVEELEKHEKSLSKKAA